MLYTRKKRSKKRNTSESRRSQGRRGHSKGHAGRSHKHHQHHGHTTVHNDDQHERNKRSDYHKNLSTSSQTELVGNMEEEDLSSLCNRNISRHDNRISSPISSNRDISRSEDRVTSSGHHSGHDDRVTSSGHHSRHEDRVTSSGHHSGHDDRVASGTRIDITGSNREIYVMKPMYTKSSRSLNV